MEKKTIGQFIAILRKAKGMTQKDLAEKLNVSDKAVSRWERDECAPDLSLIPVIAEIFQVTTDELLRGERKNVEQTQQSETPEEKISVKSEKQVERLLAKSKTGMTIGSILSLGIAIVGLLVALLCNFAFLKSYLGFFIGCVFFLGAGACLVIFHLLALSSIQGGEIEGMEQEFAKTKQFFATTTFKTTFGILLIFVATLPFAISGNSHWGLTASSWFSETIVYELLALIIGGILYLIFRSRTVKANYVFMSEREKTVYNNNKALRKKLCKRVGPFVAVLLVLFIVNEILPDELYMTTAPRVFTSVEEFKTFMETPMEFYETENGYAIVHEDVYSPSTTIVGSVTGSELAELDAKDEFNDVINMENNNYYPEQNIRKPNGAVYDTFTNANRSVYSWSVEWDGDVPTFTVIERSQIYHAGWIENIIARILLGADLILVLSAVFYYLYKRERA